MRLYSSLMLKKNFNPLNVFSLVLEMNDFITCTWKYEIEGMNQGQLRNLREPCITPGCCCITVEAQHGCSITGRAFAAAPAAPLFQWRHVTAMQTRMHSRKWKLPGRRLLFCTVNLSNYMCTVQSASFHKEASSVWLLLTHIPNRLICWLLLQSINNKMRWCQKYIRKRQKAQSDHMSKTLFN